MVNNYTTEKDGRFLWNIYYGIDMESEQNKNDIVQVKNVKFGYKKLKIQYFIDSNKNIYLHEDILNTADPSVIGSFLK